MDPHEALDKFAPSCVKCKKAGKLRCSRCGATYCAAECQKADWKAHKPLCTKPTSTAADGASKRAGFAAKLSEGFVRPTACATGVDTESIEKYKAKLKKMYRITDKEIQKVSSEFCLAAKMVAAMGVDKSIDGSDLPFREGNLKHHAGCDHDRDLAVCLVAGADPNFLISSWCPSHDVHEQHCLLHCIHPAPDTTIIGMLLKAGAYVDGGNLSHMSSPLLSAISCANVPAVKLYVESGADLKARDTTGCTVLHYALQRSVADQLNQFLGPRRAADKSRKMEEWADAYLANWQSYRLEIFRYLMSFPAAREMVNELDQDGNTPLCAAASTEEDEPELFKLLYEAGADIKRQNYRGHSPLKIASMYTNKPRCVEYLVELLAPHDPAYVREEVGKAMKVRMKVMAGKEDEDDDGDE